MKTARMRIFLLAAGLLFCYGPAIDLVAQEKEPPPSEAKAVGKGETHQGKPVSFWMKKKLEYSKNVLEGIAAGDFDQVAQNAQTMRGLNAVESFVRGRNPGYRAQLQLFEESLDEIIRQSNKENLEGITLGFHQLTTSCVHCHKQLRQVK